MTVAEIIERLGPREGVRVAGVCIGGGGSTPGNRTGAGAGLDAPGGGGGAGRRRENDHHLLPGPDGRTKQEGGEG